MKDCFACAQKIEIFAIEKKHSNKCYYLIGELFDLLLKT